MKCLSKDPNDRYASAEAFLPAIERVLRTGRTSLSWEAKAREALKVRVRQALGFSDEQEVKSCANCNNQGIKTQTNISFQDIVNSHAFYERSNSRYWCQKCFVCRTWSDECSAKFPDCAGTMLINDMDTKIGQCVAWDNGKKIPLLLRKFPNSDEQMRDRGQRAFDLIFGMENERLLNLVDFRELQRGKDEGLYMAKKYLPGAYLNWMAIPMTWEETAYILLCVAQALEALHRHGMVHRAVTPSSIFVDCHGKVRLGNFLLTKFGKNEFLQTGMTITDVGVPLGFLEYMSPEQVRDSTTVGPQSDIWSCGVVGFLLLQGQNPFTTNCNTRQEKIYAIDKNRTPELSATVPLKLKDILRKCLEKDEGSRYAQASELRKALEDI